MVFPYVNTGSKDPEQLWWKNISAKELLSKGTSGSSGQRTRVPAASQEHTGVFLNPVRRVFLSQRMLRPHKTPSSIILLFACWEVWCCIVAEYTCVMDSHGGPSHFTSCKCLCSWPIAQHPFPSITENFSPCVLYLFKTNVTLAALIRILHQWLLQSPPHLASSFSKRH